MKSLTQLILVILLSCFSLTSTANNCDSACQLKLVSEYFSALDKVAQANSTIADIDSLLSLMNGDVKYIHIEYQANFDRTTWRKAFIRNLKRGAYDNNENNKIKVLNSISGKNHIAIEYTHSTKQADGTWQDDGALLVLFSFRDGKISQIKEYW